MPQDNRSLLVRTRRKREGQRDKTTRLRDYVIGTHYCGYVSVPNNRFARQWAVLERTITFLKPPRLRLAAAIILSGALAFGWTSRAGPGLRFVASTSGCNQAETRQVVDSFIAAFNRGDAVALEGLLADSIRYEVGPPHGWVSQDTQTRNDLIGYLSDRHRANEQLRLESFQFRGDSAGSAGGFEFEVTRSSSDVASASAYGGKGSVECGTSPAALVLWTMDREPFVRARLPVYVGLAVLALAGILVGIIVAFRARTRRRVPTSSSSSLRR
jgi:hypothetical protein